MVSHVLIYFGHYISVYFGSTYSYYAVKGIRQSIPHKSETNKENGHQFHMHILNYEYASIIQLCVKSNNKNQIDIKLHSLEFITFQYIHITGYCESSSFLFNYYQSIS